MIIGEFTNPQAIQKVFDQGMVAFSDKDLEKVKDTYRKNVVSSGASIIERHEIQQSRLKPLFDKYDKAEQNKTALPQNEKENDQGIGL